MRLRNRNAGPATADSAANASKTPEQARIDAYVEPLVARGEPAGYEVPGPVTSELYARLEPSDIAATEAALEGSARELWDQTAPAQRQALTLIFGVYYDIPGVLERTGLVRAIPPEDVHSMSRGVLTFAGDPMLADTVALSFAECGLPVPDNGTLLDFGCSSGRILRVFAALRPELECVGCDPNGGAITWADEHLPMARFFTNPAVPPMALDTASVDRAYAISIWSHFDAEPALAWLAEMYRVIKPGGALLITTHGFDTLGVQLRQDVMTKDSAAEAGATMLRSGHQYFDIFGTDGDWGVKDPGWGNAYVSVEWIAEHLTPAWNLRLYRSGRLAHNQDIYVLERR